MLDAWVIDSIVRRDRDAERQPQIELPIEYEDPPEREASPDPEVERGVVVIDT